MYDLICIGEAIIDFIPLDSFIYKAAFGGAPLNCAVAASKLGLKVGVITAVGRDAFGNFILNTLKKHNIDVSHVKIVPYRTTLAMVVKLEHGEREFFFYRKPWSLSADTELEINENDLKYAENSKIIHLTGFILSQEPARSNVLKLLDYVKDKVTISFDPTYRSDVWSTVDEAKRVYREVLNYVDIVLATKKEYEVIINKREINDIIDTCRELGIKIIGIKMGENGAVLANDKKAVYCSAFKVEVKDTVGAGDAWNAAILYSMVNNVELHEAVRIANAVAAIKCMHVGAISGLPSIKEVKDFMKTHKVQCYEI